MKNTIEDLDKIKLQAETLQELVESMIVDLENKIPLWIIESLYFKDIPELINEIIFSTQEIKTK